MPYLINTVSIIASEEILSPFRYPGGKTWLVPLVRSWLRSLPSKPAQFIEPFAGGASVSLAVANEHLAARVVMIEKDEDVAAVWSTIFSDEAIWLAQEILGFDLNRESLAAWLSRNEMNVRERAFRTILINRVSHGGKLAPGSGLLNRGENGHGIRSRWYPDTLSSRVLKVAKMSDRICFTPGDGVEIIRNNHQMDNSVFFIDPPYPKAGGKLYRVSDVDHVDLFRLVSRLDCDFLMTYDDSEFIKDLASENQFEIETIIMKNTQYYDRTELLIGRNLEWFRRYVASFHQGELFDSGSTS